MGSACPLHFGAARPGQIEHLQAYGHGRRQVHEIEATESAGAPRASGSGGGMLSPPIR